VSTSLREEAQSALLTDLYQLRMLQTYVEQGMEEPAVFEFFVRRLPPGRGFLLAAGLEQALEYLEALHFSEPELEWLGATGRFPASFLDYLARLRFRGDVHALPEGSVCFPNQPLLRVLAPLPQAQLVETRLINLLHFQTLIASKAARLVLRAGGRPLIDFGLRRAHGAEAGLLAARASYLAGFAGTATVLAGAHFGVPLYGTMAHSFVQAHLDESEAFLRFAASHPEQVVLLLDTYDTEAAAHKVVALAGALARRGIAVAGVRLDSGDLADHARKVRRILDAGGLTEVRILVSGNIDEAALARLVESGAPIDSFAVGTHLTTSSDAPYLDCAYKLQEYAGRPCRKRSEGKATWPGRKQVYRRHGPDGRMQGDVISLEGDLQQGTPLLEPVMRDGRRLASPRPLAELRDAVADALACLPEPLRTLQEGASYPVEIAQSLRELASSVDRRG
jgi:nicotinate phosphoribosyltransferase